MSTIQGMVCEKHKHIAPFMCEVCYAIKPLEKEISRLQSALDKEHENFLAVHRENMKLVARRVELKDQLARSESENKKLMNIAYWPHGKLSDLGDDHCCHFIAEDIDKALNPDQGETK